MNRLALVLVVGFLIASAGGFLEFVHTEPCTATESSSTPFDASCPPTCMRCHCALAFDVVALIAIAELPLMRSEFPQPYAAPTLPEPDDILHVPRPTRG